MLPPPGANSQAAPYGNTGQNVQILPFAENGRESVENLRAQRRLIDRQIMVEESWLKSRDELESEAVSRRSAGPADSPPAQWKKHVDLKLQEVVAENKKLLDENRLQQKELVAAAAVA